MAVQFELGTKHLENKKQANTVISGINTDSTKTAVKELLNNSYGFMPSDSTAYNDYLGLAVVVEEIAKTAPEAASVLVDQVIVQELLKKYGTGNAGYSSNEVYAILCAEPGIADIKGLSTKAVRNGSTWHIEGKKQVRNEHLIADKYLVYALDEENLVRVFMVSEDSIRINQVSKNIAGTNISLSQVELNLDVADSSNVATIGDECERMMSIARTLIAAVSLGIAHSAIVAGITTSKEVKGPDKQSISGTQSIQFTLADMYGELEAGRMLTYYSADLVDNNKANIKYATMAKVQSTEAASQLSMQALEILGNLGYLANNDFADVIRVAVDGQVKGGTNRIQKNQIYQYMLARK